jgi:serine/threonine protein kinase
MAPEMVIMLSQTRREKTGYTAAVDFWSLGATMFNLLTGRRPFSDKSFEEMVDMATTMQQNVDEHAMRNNKEYVMLFRKIEYPDYLSADAKDLLSHFLDTNPATRYGSRGMKEVFAHPFFAGIDWSHLELKHIEPPFVPSVGNSTSMKKNSSNKNSVALDFQAAMDKYGKTHFLDPAGAPPTSQQKYFASWDFASAHTVRVEAGLSHVMEQYDKNFKVRQIIGDMTDNKVQERKKSMVLSAAQPTR